MKYNLSNIRKFCDSWHQDVHKLIMSKTIHNRICKFIDNWPNRNNYDVEIWEKHTEQFVSAMEQSRKQIKFLAPKANIIEVLNLGFNEVKHSRMLAWLLDANSTHKQGTIFFEHFLMLLGLYGKNYHFNRYEVAREWPELIDLSLYSKNNFSIFIENKVRHYERTNQLYDEYCYLQKWSDNWNIPPQNRHLVFLSPDGREPISLGKFSGKSINISWLDVAKEIKKAALSEQCYSEYIKRLSTDYTKQVIKHISHLIN